jgi:hypothetical protein
MLCKTFFNCCLIFFLSFKCFSQDKDCELILTRATDEFNAGHFYAIPLILDDCLHQFTQEQRQRANILLTQTYLLLDDPTGAKRSYLEVLRANPEFVTDEKIHPIDVVYFSKRFTSTPVVSWLVKGGTNISPMRVIHDLDPFGTDAPEKYIMRVGYQAGVGLDIHLNEKIAIRSEMNLLFTGYRHKTLNYFEGDSKDFSDRQTWVGIPLALMLSDTKGKYRPYSYIGYAANVLIKDVATIAIVKTEVESMDSKSPTLRFDHKRNGLNQAIVLGGGIKYKFGLDFLFVDIRYCVGLNNVVKEKNLFANYEKFPGTSRDFPVTSSQFIDSFEPVASFVHVDDYFRMDNLSISIGFIQPIYNPRELKRHRTESVLKKLKLRHSE